MSTSNQLRDIFGFILMILVVFALFIMNGCAYQTSQWKEPASGLSYKQTNITPIFGKQAESVGEMFATIDKGGTWELMIGRADKGIDNTTQAEVALKIMELAIALGKMSATGGIPIP